MVAASSSVRSKNKLLGSACAAELSEDGVCGDVQGVLVVMCLREARHKTNAAAADATFPFSSACSSAVLATAIRSASDVTLDAAVADACGPEVADDGLCGSLPASPGAALSCLRGAVSGPSLSPKCRKAVFKREELDAGDVRLDPALAAACAAEMSEFCAAVAPGEGGVVACLWEHRKKPSFSEGCRKKASGAMRDSSTDARLNFQIMKHCKADTAAFCAEQADAVVAREVFHEGGIIACLKERFDELAEPMCRAAVGRVAAAQSENFFADAPFVRACAEDALENGCCKSEEECRNIDNGESIHHCLKESYDSLSPPCQHQLLVQTKVESHSISMKPALMAACEPLIERACADKDAAHAAVISCLQDHRWVCPAGAEFESGARGRAKGAAIGAMGMSEGSSERRERPRSRSTH
jgi:hypothetical protein